MVDRLSLSDIDERVGGYHKVANQGWGNGIERVNERVDNA